MDEDSPSFIGKEGRRDDLGARDPENARFSKKRYEEISGTADYFGKILFGPYQEADFLLFQPGETVAQTPFLR